MSRNPGQNSMTWAEVMIDGQSIGKWDNAGGTDHAEIKLLQYLREKYRPEELRGKLVSIVINRAPCGPCAKALAAFKQEYGVHMRVKATRITRDGQGGLPVLSAAGIHFRLYTRAQRDSIHTATASNKRTWKGRKGAAVTESDRYKQVSDGRDTKTLTEQEEAEAAEASLAEEHFPNARKGWSAQNLSRAKILGGGSGSSSSGSRKVDTKKSNSNSESGSSLRYTPYSRGSTPTVYASLTPTVDVDSWEEVHNRSWNAGDRFRVAGEGPVYRFLHDHHGGMRARYKTDYIVHLQGG